MKKKLIIICIVALIFVAIIFIFTGRARTDVYLKDYKLSEDGKTMTIEVGVSGSSGYVRKMKRTSGSTNHYYTFYSTYGINSKLGAKDTFEIELGGDEDEIYFYTGNKGYKLVLIKDKTFAWENTWKEIKYTNDRTIKLELIDINTITKIGINTLALNNNYFEYSDKDTITKIYNFLNNLETEIISKTVNPENPEELYAITFIDDNEENNRVDTYLEVYRKNGKYYAEQKYNGIYEITEADFNMIKSYIKK